MNGLESEQIVDLLIAPMGISTIGMITSWHANDDVKGYKPYGELFSKLEVNLSAGTTYYVVVRNSHAFGELKTRFVVENMQQSTPASARVLPWGELVDTDLNGAPNRITSLYDVDLDLCQ